MLHNSIWEGLELCFDGPSPQKLPRGDGTVSLPLLRHPWICMLCKQTSPKLWFANVNITSYCDVTDRVYPGTMTTICYCSILEFGRGHPIKQSPRASPDLCTPPYEADTGKVCFHSRDRFSGWAFVNCQTVRANAHRLPANHFLLWWLCLWRQSDRTCNGSRLKLWLNKEI